MIPEKLHICAEELEAMKVLAPVIGRSPRATKRFVNSYRLLKASLTSKERKQFSVEDGRLEGLAAPMVLLAIITGTPALAPTFVRDLLGNTTTPALEILSSVAARSKSDPARAEAVSRIQELERTKIPPRWRELSAADLLPWISRVTQFSFENLHSPGRPDAKSGTPEAAPA